jgi:type I restriction enzyme, S subunit
MNAMKIGNKNIKPGYQKTKLGWLPEDWRLKKLADVIELESGQHLSPDEYNNEGEGSPYFTGPTDFCSSIEEVTKWTKDAGKYAESGDILITVKGSGVGTLYVTDIKKVAIGRQLMAIKPQKMDRGYLYNFLKQRSQVFEILASGNMIPGLSRNDILSFKAPCPPINEQRKIAGILSIWDEAISKIEKLIQAKKRYKKGLMQRLLSGKVRFPEFVKSEEVRKSRFGIYPKDWEYLKIQEIATQVKNKVGDESEGYTVMSCTKHDGLVSSLEYFDRQVFSKDISNYKAVKKDEFAYATNHVEGFSIGYNNWCEKGAISPMYTVFKADQNKIDNEYLYGIIKTENYRRIFEIFTNGTVNRRGSLRWKDFKKIKVPVPALEEQKAISTVLKKAEQEILLLEEQLEKYQQQKKGLMQQLLTGKVRVN